MLRFSTRSIGEDFNLKLRLLPRIDNFRVCVFRVVGEIRDIDVHIQSACPRGVSGNVTKDPESRSDAEATLKRWTWQPHVEGIVVKLVHMFTCQIRSEARHPVILL